MTTVIKTPPTARFENRFPPDEELTETERAARRERTHRAAAAYEAFKATGGERIIHRTPERIAVGGRTTAPTDRSTAGGAQGRRR